MTPVSLFYDYLIQPGRTLAIHFQQAIGISTALVIFLLAFLWPANLVNAGIGIHILGMIIISFICLYQSWAIDWIAQVCGHSSQSAALFRWLPFSYLPFTLSIPLERLLPDSFLNFLILALVIYLQVITVRRAYQNISATQQWLVLTSPYFLILGLPIIFISMIVITVLLLAL